MSENIYDSTPLLDQYLAFHYGREEQVLPWKNGPSAAMNFPQRCVDEGVDKSRIPDGFVRALDVGCAVGRSSFALGQICQEVIGIDYSQQFVDAASQLKAEGSLDIEMIRTGTLTERLSLRAPDSGLGILTFEQGDAQDLRDDLGSFQIVLAANLLCRLGQPKKFLSRLRQLVSPGGQLIITTPNTWLEEFTAKDYWLGATPETGEPLEALQKELSESFELDRTWDMPFLIREHERKYQWSVAQASRWIRKEE